MNTDDETVSVIDALSFLTWKTLGDITEEANALLATRCEALGVETREMGPRRVKQILNKLERDVAHVGKKYRYDN